MSAPSAGRRQREVVLASSNPGKLREIHSVLRELPMTLRSLDEFPTVRLPAEGDEYEANAVAKARAAARASGRLALADDSGLEVEALGGGPGPHSARFGGCGLDDSGRVHKLLEALAGTSARGRRARFVCVAALATPAGEVVTRRGECRGRILETPRGRGGFGYDPVFGVEGSETSMAELSPREKERISHRGRAFRALAHELRARLEPDSP